MKFPCDGKKDGKYKTVKNRHSSTWGCNQECSSMVKLLPGHCWWLSHDSHGPEIHIASIIHQPVYTYVTHQKKTGDSLKVYIKYVYIYPITTTMYY